MNVTILSRKKKCTLKIALEIAHAHITMKTRVSNCHKATSFLGKKKEKKRDKTQKTEEEKFYIKYQSYCSSLIESPWDLE